ncbi:unnamed protein product [Arabidopsis halleri]
MILKSHALKNSSSEVKSTAISFGLISTMSSLKKKMKSPATNSKKRSPGSSPYPSLPDDLIVSILARVSRMYYPNLSLVSKSFRSTLLLWNCRLSYLLVIISTPLVQISKRLLTLTYLLLIVELTLGMKLQE